MEIDVKFRNGLISSSEPSEHPTPFKEIQPQPSANKEDIHVSKILKLENLTLE